MLRLEDLLRVLIRGVFYLSKYSCTAAVESCPLFVFATVWRLYSEWACGDGDFLSGPGNGFFLNLRSAVTAGDEVCLCDGVGII